MGTPAEAMLSREVMLSPNAVPLVSSPSSCCASNLPQAGSVDQADEFLPMGQSGSWHRKDLRPGRQPGPGPPGVGSRCTTCAQISPAARLGCSGARWSPGVRQQDEATRENQYLLKLLADFGIDVILPVAVTIGQGNQSTIQLATSGHCNPRTKHKHVALRYMYVHELQQQGIVALKWVPTDSMLADVLTKALSKADHNRLCSVLMGRSVLQWPSTAPNWLWF
jgi:hypothetical protein